MYFLLNSYVRDFVCVLLHDSLSYIPLKGSYNWFYYFFFIAMENKISQFKSGPWMYLKEIKAAVSTEII